MTFCFLTSCLGALSGSFLFLFHF
uniref:Uncharacterized protein n=1 Tax=Anguilla anguilla TaxID=7936 RepID=A0A0E9PYU9_ANGAN